MGACHITLGAACLGAYPGVGAYPGYYGNGNYVREFQTLPKKVEELVLLPDCELWGTTGDIKTIMIYRG